MSKKPCIEKARLLQEYQESTQVYATAVDDLNRRIGIVQFEEYQKLNRAADRARRKSEDSRDRLARHIAEDRC